MPTQFDTEAAYGALSERVANQGARLNNLEAAMDRGFRNVEASISSLSAEFRNTQRPQWQAIGVALSFAIAIGALAYWPIRDAQSDAKAAIAGLQVNALSVAAFQDFRATYENNRLVARQDNDVKFARVEAAVARIEAALVPRGEHNEKWESQRQRDVDMQRQVDELKAALGGLYGARDVIIDLRERLDRIERARIGGIVR